MLFFSSFIHTVQERISVLCFLDLGIPLWFYLNVRLHLIRPHIEFRLRPLLLFLFPCQTIIVYQCNFDHIFCALLGTLSTLQLLSMWIFENVKVDNCSHTVISKFQLNVRLIIRLLLHVDWRSSWWILCVLWKNYFVRLYNWIFRITIKFRYTKKFENWIKFGEWCFDAPWINHEVDMKIFLRSEMIKNKIVSVACVGYIIHLCYCIFLCTSYPQLVTLCKFGFALCIDCTRKITLFNIWCFAAQFTGMRKTFN